MATGPTAGAKSYLVLYRPGGKAAGVSLAAITAAGAARRIRASRPRPRRPRSVLRSTAATRRRPPQRPRPMPCPRRPPRTRTPWARSSGTCGRSTLRLRPRLRQAAAAGQPVRTCPRPAHPQGHLAEARHVGPDRSRRRGRRAGRSWVDAAARRMAKGRDLRALSLAGAMATAERLGVEGSPGVPVGRTVLGRQRDYGSWEDMHLDIWAPAQARPPPGRSPRSSPPPARPW